MDYLSADTELQSARNEANGKPIANNTRLYRRGDGVIALTLHATDVVTFYRDGRIVLDSGGWRTVTTKDRIGYAANVYSVKGEWYVDNPQPNDPRPEYPHREIDKPFAAIDPGPEPVKDPEGCIAGQSRTELVDERHYIKRDELLDGEDFEDAGTSAGDYVWVTRAGKKTTYWGSERHRYEEERHSDIPIHTSTYEQCEHCRAHQARHDSWDEFMNGNRWTHPRGRGYRQMVEYLERFGSREAWMQAYKEEGREVRAGQAAFREWEERNRTPFFDGIELVDGRVTNAPDTGEVDAFQRAVADEKKRISKFIKLARETLAKGMPMPGPGDCWYCALSAHDGVPLGDAVDTLHPDGSLTVEANHEHLRHHMEEEYVVPSLLTNAMLEAGYKPVGVYMLLDMDQDAHTMGGHETRDWSNSYDKGPYSTMARALRKYLTKRLVPTNAKEVTTSA